MISEPSKHNLSPSRSELTLSGSVVRLHGFGLGGVAQRSEGGPVTWMGRFESSSDLGAVVD